ncbi:MAG: N-6 DNA methylase [FCB group bacterium]|nr:N-6 DNA methylase [FCB group bacterium]
MTAVSDYIKAIEKEYQTEQAREHAYRPALKTLIESVESGFHAVNEPARTACGAPDFIVLEDGIQTGFIEAKDIDAALDKEEKSEQLKRYRAGFSNLILTNYLEFRWYVEGEKRMTAVIGEIGLDGKIKKSDEGCRETLVLLNEFFKNYGPSIGDSKELAKRMASIARIIKNAIAKALEEDEEDSQLIDQLDGFRKVLIHDLKEDDFADMYAQTICYGLFAARCNHDVNERFERTHAAHYLPETNPFLRKLFQKIAGFDLDPRIAWAVDNMAELLNKSDMHSVLADFGKRTKREDPVVHFYETFLSSYNPKLREMRGVYYTPEPVVSYIVRSVDHILKNDFGLPEGLADSSKIKVKTSGGADKEFHKVLVLDPAVGTGTFLHGVIDHIHESFAGREGQWSSYVSQHLLPRIFGFELLMAPYAVAHMKLGLQLKELGYEFDTGERLGIYLTNTLEEDFGDQKIPFMKWLAEEANEAGKIKSEYPVMVILGNPPYSVTSQTKGGWVEDDVRKYYYPHDEIKESNPKVLLDDYVKFIRFSQWKIEKKGSGILAFISNHGYLDNPTFRQMRKSLMDSLMIFILLIYMAIPEKRKNVPMAQKMKMFSIFSKVWQ